MRAVSSLVLVASALVSCPAFSFVTAGYFPLTDGATWTFNKNGSGSYTRQVLTGTETVNGAVTKVMQYPNGDKENFTNDASGIRSHRTFTQDVNTGVGIYDQYMTVNPPTPWLAANATEGTAVTVTAGGATLTFVGGFPPACPLNYNSSATPVGFEMVTVPAGTFNALRLNQSFTLYGSCGGPPINVTVTATYYLVEGLGPVKFIDPNNDTYNLTASSLLVAATVAKKSDVSGDGKGDIVWRNITDGRNFVWVMNGSVHPESQLPTVGTGFEAVAVADFNADGRMDILWRNAADGRNYVWLMNAGGTSRTEVQLPSVPPGFQVAGTGDFNGDVKADILWRHGTDGRNFVWIMNGASRTETQLPNVANAFSVAAIGKFNSDGMSDILWRNSADGRNYVWLMNGTTRTETQLPSVAAAFQLKGTGDFNGDGRLDLLWRHNTDGRNYVWIMNGATRTEAQLPSVANAFSVAAIGTFNNDSRSDILWRNGADGRNYLWRMGASGTTRTETQWPSVPAAYQLIATADYDNNGSTDILWRHGTDGRVFQWMINPSTLVRTETSLGTVSPASYGIVTK